MIASHFPVGLARGFDLECRLGSNQSATDFLFCVTRAERELLASPASLSALDPAILSLPLWQQIIHFIDAWHDPSSLLHQKVLMVWFEFDLGVSPGSIYGPLAAPGFFFGSKEFPAAGALSRDADNWLVKMALPILAGGSLSPAVEANVQRVSACLPTGAHIYQVGAFFARPSPDIRLCLTGIPHDMLEPYLREIGYTVDLSGLSSAASDLAAFSEIHVDLDIGENIGQKVGLECVQSRSSLAAMAENRALLLDWLERFGLCSPEQQEGLLAFPGMEALIDGNGPDTLSVLLGDLSHVKVVYQPQRPLEAKAYLQITHAELDAVGAAASQLAFIARQQAARRALDGIKTNRTGLFAKQAVG